MADRRSWGDYVLAAGIALVAAAVSPLGIALMVGRPDVSFRVTVLSLALVIFLLTIVGAVLARGRLRAFFFYLMIWTSPLPLMAAAEAAAIATHLADRIAPVVEFFNAQELEALAAVSPQRGALGAAAARRRPSLQAVGRPRCQNQQHGATHYRAAAEGAGRMAHRDHRWLDRLRLAGVRPRHAPGAVQEALRRKHPNVKVYNFGIEGATVARELGLLKRFHKLYEIDEVVFYTGGNDVIYSYLSAMIPDETTRRISAKLNAFELVRAASRLIAATTDPSTQALAHLDEVVLPEIIKRNPLRQGVEAADAYCRAEVLRCQLLLQPAIYTRRPPRGPEVAIALTAERVHPGLSALGVKMYRDALDNPPQMPVSDLSDVFNPSDRPFYVDALHINEEGNAYLAEQLAARLSARLP